MLNTRLWLCQIISAPFASTYTSSVSGIVFSSTLECYFSKLSVTGIKQFSFACQFISVASIVSSFCDKSLCTLYFVGNKASSSLVLHPCYVYNIVSY